MQFSKIETAGTAEIGGITGRLVGVTGVEPVTSSLSGTRSNQLSYTPGCVGGGNGIRTRDFQLAKLALYQLSYAPGTFCQGSAKAQFARDAYIPEHSCSCCRSRSGAASTQPVSRRVFLRPRSSRGSSRPCGRMIVRILRRRGRSPAFEGFSLERR